MEILQFETKQAPRPLESVPSLPAKGFVWLDIVRGEDDDWPTLVEQLTGVRIHERHLRDANNLQHPSYFDSTSDYDMVIFRGLSPEEGDGFETRPTVLFLFAHLAVTIRAADSRSIGTAKERLLAKRTRIPQRPAGLMHLILSLGVDRFMDMRDPLTRQLEDWRRDLLDPKHPFDDWFTLMEHGNQLRSLGMLCEEQEDAVTQWRDNTTIDMDDHIAVRYNDLLEHIRRVMRFAQEQQASVESLVQLHFSAVAHRTNEIMRLLTVVSAIFLPLSLVAGIFGMNFQHMPELQYRYAYFFALGGMFGLAAVMLAIFKWKRWF